MPVTSPKIIGVIIGWVDGAQQAENYVSLAALAGVPRIDLGPGPLYIDGVACCRTCQEPIVSARLKAVPGCRGAGVQRLPRLRGGGRERVERIQGKEKAPVVSRGLGCKCVGLVFYFGSNTSSGPSAG